MTAISRNGRRPARTLVGAGVLVVAMASLCIGVRAADDKELQRLKGTVGYQRDAATALTPVVAKMLLPDDYFALTRASSAALLELPDSSLVALGENTDVQVGAFTRAAAGPGSTITVNGGTLRFDIRRPQGGVANYRFTTTTTQIAVRGTVGLLSFVDGTTAVGCLVCAADSITVTVGSQTFALASGGLLTVSAAGAVVTGTLTTTALSGFAAAGVSTSSASGVAAAASIPGVNAAAVAGAAAGGVSGGAAAAAAAGLVGVGAAASAISNSTVNASNANLPTTPAPGATQAGSVNLSGKARAQVSTPAPALAPAPGPPAPIAGRH